MSTYLNPPPLMKTTLPSCSTLLIFFVLCLQLSSCNDAPIVTPQNKAIEVVDSSSITKVDTIETNQSDLNPTPIWGYRFIIVGDFDGNGKEDTLRERHVALATNQETNKYFEGVESIWHQGNEYHPVRSFLQANPTSGINELDSLGQLGLHWLENIGDIDGNGTDEIGLLKDGADYSNVNTYAIYTYRKKKWQLIYDIEVRESEFPYLPTFNPMDGYSSQHETISPEQIVANQQYQQAIDSFHLIKIIGDKTIEVEQCFCCNCQHQYKLATKLNKDSTNGIWVTNIGKQRYPTVRLTHIKVGYGYTSGEEVMKEIANGSLDLCEGANWFTAHVVFK